MTKPTLGIIGAGKLGITLGKLAREAGYKVFISGSKSAEKIQLTVEILVPGAVASTTEEVAAQADIIILAVPLSKYQQINSELFADKILIDAMNYWWEVDGVDQIYSDKNGSSSEKVQQYFSKSIVIKAFNHIGYHNLEEDARQNSHENRKVVLIAGNQLEAVNKVQKIVDDFGFSSRFIGNLKNGIILEPGSSLFGASLEAEKIEELIQEELVKHALTT